VPVPASVDQRRQRGGRPGVEDVLFGAQILACTLGTGVDRRIVRERIDRQVLAVGDNRLAAVLAVPDRDRDARIALSRDTPVPLQPLDPVFVPGVHLLGVPVHLPAGLQILVLFVEDFDVPLLGDEEFDVGRTALVDVDVVADLPAVPKVALIVEILDDLFASLVGREPFVLLGEIGHRSGLVDGDAERQVVGLIPLDVGLVAEGTGHHDAGPFLHVDALVLDDRHFVTEERDPSSLPDQMCVLLVVGMDEHGDTRGEQFGAGRRDDDVLAGVLLALPARWFRLALDVSESHVVVV
jgi:hypothetical protein